MRSGVYTALITPFHEDGSFDAEGFRENLRFQLFSGVEGVVVLGTTGEVPTLESVEKQQILEIAVEEVKNKAFLIVGTGSNSTKKTLEETQIAKEMGADASLIVTPYYNRPTQDGLFQHFQAIAKIGLPIIAYNVPGRTGINLQTETLARLAEIPEIIAVKEASGNLNQMMDIIDKMRLIRPDFKVFSGDDNLTFPLISLGGHGIISVVSNLLPQTIVEMVGLALAEKTAEARKLHFDLLKVCNAAFIETNPIPIKTMMQFANMPSGPCRLPLCNLSADNENYLKQLLQSIKFESIWEHNKPISNEVY